ncbi:MAG: hypothetical protein ABSC94_32035 [Polyangiaceae bacterium]|jgi:hypothetical protein
MSKAGGWEGIPLDLVPHVNAFKEAARGLGYDARIGIKTNARGALVVALIVEPPLPARIDAREAIRPEKLKRS